MKSILVLLATLSFALAPAFAPSFMGYDPSMFPVQIGRPSVQPAGYAFSIWGPIYLWLIVHAVFGMWRRTNPVWEQVRLPHLGALVLGTVWLYIAGGYPLTATVAILAMAGFGITAFLAADLNKDRWLLAAPLGLFAGWLTAACMVSLGVILAGYGWLSDTGSALAMLAVVLAIAVTVQLRRRSMPIYSVSVVWAAIGIAVVNWPANPPVAYAALAGAAVQAAVAVWGLLRR